MSCNNKCSNLIRDCLDWTVLLREIKTVCKNQFSCCHWWLSQFAQNSLFNWGTDFCSTPNFRSEEISLCITCHLYNQLNQIGYLTFPLDDKKKVKALLIVFCQDITTSCNHETMSNWIQQVMTFSYERWHIPPEQTICSPNVTFRITVPFVLTQCSHGQG